MKLTFDTQLSTGYKSSSQKIRVMSEHWVGKNIYCPSCGKEGIENYASNKPVADFYCNECNEDFELKSKKGYLGRKIVDGAYHTMIKRLSSAANPNFSFLNYDSGLSVKNFMVIPKHYFIPEIIERRKPLAVGTKRAGWVGCNIVMDTIPQSGKIFLIQNGIERDRGIVLNEWKKTLFLREENNLENKTWLMDVIRCIEKINKTNFTLDEVYSFEKELKSLHPSNNHIQPKI